MWLVINVAHHTSIIFDKDKKYTCAYVQKCAWDHTTSLGLKYIYIYEFNGSIFCLTLILKYWLPFFWNVLYNISIKIWWGLLDFGVYRCSILITYHRALLELELVSNKEWLSCMQYKEAWTCINIVIYTHPLIPNWSHRDLTRRNMQDSYSCHVTSMLSMNIRICRQPCKMKPDVSLTLAIASGSLHVLLINNSHIHSFFNMFQHGNFSYQAMTKLSILQPPECYEFRVKKFRPFDDIELAFTAYHPSTLVQILKQLLLEGILKPHFLAFCTVFIWEKIKDDNGL